MPGAIAGWKIIPNALIKTQQTDGVTLLEEKVGEGGGQCVRIIGFGPIAGAEGHRATLIDQQVATQIGFIFKLLDVIAVAAGVHAPVDIARVIAGYVLAVLRELDREAVVGAAVDTVPKALHDNARAQFQTADLHQGARVDKPITRRVGGGFRHPGSRGRAVAR